MTTQHPPQSGGTARNELDGAADNVVQAATIYGGVHFNQPAKQKSSFATTKKAFLLLAGISAVASTLWAGIAHFPAAGTGQPSAPVLPPPSPEQVAASRVAQCKAQHHMTRQSEQRQKPDSVTAFVSCAWPPLPYTDADGFAEITAETRSRPDESEASGASSVDRIIGSCHTFTLSYDFGYQGDLQHRPPFNAPTGLITSLDAPGSPWPPGASALDFYPGRNEVAVIHNSHNGIADAKCAD
jgi:hypothetical protein